MGGYLGIVPCIGMPFNIYIEYIYYIEKVCKIKKNGFEVTDKWYTMWVDVLIKVKGHWRFGVDIKVSYISFLILLPIH